LKKSRINLTAAARPRSQHDKQRLGVQPVTKPLYRAKAEFFKALGHPVRIRVLELLAEREHAVAELLPQVGVEPAQLSQQLAVLRRMNLAVSRRDGQTVYYSLVSPQVAELLAAARRILTEVLLVQVELLGDLNGAGDSGKGAATRLPLVP
jgi:DNA-binding transcriptional ArsR family regulator